MQYYKLYPCTELNVIGTYNQVQKFELPEGIETLKMGEILNYKNIPHTGLTSFNPIFPVCKLHSKSKTTDFINSNFSEVDLVSPKVLDIIKSINSDTIEYYKINLKKGSILLPYFGLRFPFIRDQEFIDWKNTYFARTKLEIFSSNPIEIHQFKGEDDYILCRNNAFLNNEKIYPIKLYLKNTAKDIFRLSFANQGIIISEKLKIALETNNITGRRYINVDDLIPESSQP
jgi:hypothetical protein